MSLGSAPVAQFSLIEIAPKGVEMKKQTFHDEESFFEALKKDLNAAKGLVLIRSAFITPKRVQFLAPTLESCVKRRVRVCVEVQQLSNQFPNEDFAFRQDAFDQAIRKLHSIGVHTTIIPKVHEKLIVIDAEIFWDGSLNPLSHRDTSERMTRTVDPDVVQDVLKRHKLGRCETCAELRMTKLLHPRQLTTKNLRDVLTKQIREQRIAIGWSQRELGVRTGVSQKVISQFENSKRDLRFDTLFRILLALEMNLGIVPWWFGPTLNEIVHDAQQGLMGA